MRSEDGIVRTERVRTERIRTERIRTEREGGREGGLITRYEVLCRVWCKQGIEQTTYI